MSIPTLPLTDNPVDLLREAQDELRESFEALTRGQMTADHHVGAWIDRMQTVVSDISCLLAAIDDGLLNGDFAA